MAYRRGSKFMLFSVDTQLYPCTFCWKDGSFPYRTVLDPCQKKKKKNHSQKFYFWTVNFIPLIYIAVFMWVSSSFDHFSFIVNFRNRKCQFFQFVLLQDCLDYTGYLEFSMNFRNHFIHFCKDNSWDFDRECTNCVTI